jgi:hypothetical protein
MKKSLKVSRLEVLVVIAVVMALVAIVIVLYSNTSLNEALALANKEQSCLRCGDKFDLELVEFRENIATVGRGDIGTKAYDIVPIQAYEECADAIYLKQIKTSDGFNCEKFCPSHPNDCWTLFATGGCGNYSGPNPECIDIAGETIIKSDFLNLVENPSGMMYKDAMIITATSSPLTIEKTGPNEITISTF